MKLKYIPIILLILSVSVAPIYAGKYTASFLQIGAGARFLGMGGAGLAISGDVSSFYWNPAGLAKIRNLKLQLMYATQFGGFSNPLGDYQYVGAAFPIRNDAVLALNWIRFSVNDIPLYPELEGQNFFQRLQNPAIRPDGKPTGYIKDVENAFFISFSKNNRFVLDLGWEYFKIPIEVPFGFNFKILQTSLGEENATGLGIDFGSMILMDLNDLFFSNNLGKFGFGINVKDITKTSLSWSTKHRDSIPRSLNMGVSYQQNIKKIDSVFLLSYSYIGKEFRDNRLGLEWFYRNHLFLRCGIKEAGYTAGIGFSFSLFQINYAFENQELGNSHRISADINLNSLIK